MRLHHPDGTTVHLAYCTNVHQAESLDEVLAQLERFAEPVRRMLETDRLGLGLWLARGVATTLLDDPAAVRTLRRELAVRGLEVVTLNGFPYAGFHQPVVKRAVYTPDWTSTQRLDYTRDLARLLAALLPDDAAYGSISTLPLGWRQPWFRDRQQTAESLLDRLARDLTALEAETGRVVRVGLEPEPGCVVETTTHATERQSRVDKQRIGVCLDACHLAVAFGEPVAALGRLDGAGLAVVKAQVSCALQADRPWEGDTRAALESFVEPRFLHQVRARSGTGIRGTDDLDDALAGRLNGSSPWRVHYHVPVHAPAIPPLTTTQPHLLDTLRALLGGPRARTAHLEVETYTWGVLPEGQRPDDDAGLAAGLAAELAWTRDQLIELGLKEVST